MIKIQDVTKTFDGQTALDNVSLSIRKGSIYGLVGTNGSGKTTLLKHVTGVWKQDSGQILLEDVPIFDNEAAKSRIGYIPDDLFFFGSYTLKDSARYYRGLYPSWNDARYAELVKLFNLPEKQKIARFSKGMQKQAMFILVMSAMPEYLVLDEPIDGLDPIVRKHVWKVIVDDVASREMTVLVSSHNLREMEGICDTIGILDHGKVIIERDLDELKSDIHKVQIAITDPKMRDYSDLNVLHSESRGTVDLLIIRQPREEVEAILKAKNPVLFDLLPLSLEEIFIYELGGEHDVESLLF